MIYVMQIIAAKTYMMIAARTIVEFHAVSHVVNGGMVGALHLRHGSLFLVEKNGYLPHNHTWRYCVNRHR